MPKHPTESILDIDFTVSAPLAGLRMDRILSGKYPQFSRNRWQEAIKSGDVRLNGEAVKVKTRPCHGDVISGTLPNEQKTPHPAENIALPVLYADEAIIILDKPAGLVVHPAPGHLEGTLLNALLHHFPHTRHLPRGGIVHRLDKDTSGLMVVAHKAQAHTELVRQLQLRRMGRHYLALVYGYLTAGETIDLPIGRHLKARVKMAVRPDGKSAITHFRIAKRFGELTLLRVKLETGRTHQIRVHLSERGHPLVGDPLYGGNKTLPKNLTASVRSALRAFPRQVLHAETLTLTHPISGEALTFHAPPPKDIQSLLNALETSS